MELGGGRAGRGVRLQRSSTTSCCWPGRRGALPPARGPVDLDDLVLRRGPAAADRDGDLRRRRAVSAVARGDPAPWPAGAQPVDNAARHARTRVAIALSLRTDGRDAGSTSTTTARASPGRPGAGLRAVRAPRRRPRPRRRRQRAGPGDRRRGRRGATAAGGLWALSPRTASRVPLLMPTVSFAD